MSELRPEPRDTGLRLRREVVVPPAPVARPHLLVGMSVALVLLAGTVDALLWKQGAERARAAPRPAITVRIERALGEVEARAAEALWRRDFHARDPFTAMQLAERCRDR